jgi:ketosteroid isomerase-like protein
MVRRGLDRSSKGGTVSHPNEELVRRGYDAFSRGDTQTLREVFHPDVVWHAPGRSQLAGDYQGVDAVLGYFGRTMEVTGGTFTVEVHDIVAGDEHVAGFHVARGEHGGKTLADRSVLVFHVRDGRATEVWQYWGDPYAADEFLG